MTTHWSDELGDFQTHAEYPSGSVAVVGVCKIDLFLPSSHSLEDKRDHILKVKQQIEASCHVPVSEIAWQDKWQRTALAFAVVGDDRPTIQARMDAALSIIESLALGEVLDTQMEILSF